MSSRQMNVTQTLQKKKKLTFTRENTIPDWRRSKYRGPVVGTVCSLKKKKRGK